MELSSFAASVAAIVAPWLTILSLAAWCVMVLVLIAPAYRLVTGRARALDTLWSVLLLGVANRVTSDFTTIPDELQHLSAIIIAVLLIAVIRSYQRADA